MNNGGFPVKCETGWICSYNCRLFRRSSCWKQENEQLSPNNNEENKEINGCGFFICFQESSLLLVGFCLN